jgi:hypothetical protein
MLDPAILNVRPKARRVSIIAMWRYIGAQADKRRELCGFISIVHSVIYRHH